MKRFGFLIALTIAVALTWHFMPKSADAQWPVYYQYSSNCGGAVGGGGGAFGYYSPYSGGNCGGTVGGGGGAFFAPTYYRYSLPRVSYGRPVYYSRTYSAPTYRYVYPSYNVHSMTGPKYINGVCFPN